MTIEILDEAQEDLIQGFHFYENLSAGTGSRFLDCLLADIDSLLRFSGIHTIVYGFHRSLCRRFPFAIYYEVAGEVVRVYAVLDCRKNPTWIRKRLKSG
ncbi:MAG: type II toxin-antitoxin system RelE/ParE family toxin [Terriglobales bacterium]